LFDERSLFEIAHEDYPGERLVACRNPQLQKRRAYKREQLLQATEEELKKVRASVAGARLKGKGKIGVRVGRVVNKYKVAKHFTLTIEEDRFDYQRNPEQVAAEAALDGVYVLRTNVSKKQMAAEQTVRNYKALCGVERAFRSLKTVDLKIRPIHHWLEPRVRAHIFLCVLAYYVEWHMRQAWRELLFADEDIQAKAERDPVAPAKRSEAALQKIAQRTLEDGTPVHSFQTLLQELSTIVRNTCVARAQRTTPIPFQMVTTPNTTQQRALQLLQSITV
jgi:transposase